MSDGLFTVIPNTRRVIKASPEEIERFRTRRAQKKAWNDANPEKIRESRRKQRTNISAWKKRNEDAVAEHRDRENTDKYHRPFVAIDSEGMDFEGEDIVVDGVTYKKHRTFLWGAKGWKRTHYASALEKDPSLSRIEGEDTRADWLGTPEKKALTSVEILDWLTSLPDKYGPENGYANGVIFVSFAFGYDATQIIADVPYKKARKIANRKEPGQARLSSRYIFYKNYAIKYMKKKSIEIKRLRDERDPWKDVLNKDGSVSREIDSDAYICIYDAFGFFQESFVKAVSNLIKPGYISKEDWETVKSNKKERENFANVDFAQIKHYCELELTMLAKECTVLRDGFDRLDTQDNSRKPGIRLRRWDGAGSAAGAFLRKIELPKKHYSPEIATKNISLQQLRAHHSMFGGRIELLRQGYAKDRKLWVYDIASAYPFICTQLPSMHDGTWEHGCKLRIVDFEKTSADILSMFRVRWKFPERSCAHGLPIPFYPFPYRTKQKGLVLFPSSGEAWLVRDDVLAGIEWFKTFFPGAPLDRDMTIEEYSLFYPASDEKPYAFLFALYEMRKELKKSGDILEKSIKLVINSLYGKTVQSVGEPGKVPSSACPYYGSAITAGCRAQLMRAALKDPYAIVSFMTDGTASTRPLDLGERLKRKDADDVQLGDWEFEEVKNGFYLMSGIYSYLKEEKIKDGTVVEITLSRSRGFNPHKITLGKDLMDFFLDNVLPSWQRPWTKRDERFVEPTLTYKIGRYITLGDACASKNRFRLIGRWAKVPRELTLLKPGPKREMDYRHPWTYAIGAGLKLPGKKQLEKRFREMRLWFDADPNEAFACLEAGEALRCRFLVPTLPAENPTPAKLSAPSIPNWIEDMEKPDDKDGENPTPFDIDEEMAEIGAGL